MTMQKSETHPFDENKNPLHRRRTPPIPGHPINNANVNAKQWINKSNDKQINPVLKNWYPLPYAKIQGPSARKHRPSTKIQRPPINNSIEETNAKIKHSRCQTMPMINNINAKYKWIQYKQKVYPLPSTKIQGPSGKIQHPSTHAPADNTDT